MLSRSNIESLGFTFFRFVKYTNNYTTALDDVREFDEYLGHAIWNGSKNIILLQNNTDGSIVIKLFVSFINQHWNDEFLFNGDITNKEGLEDILTNKLKIKVNPVIFN